MKYEICENTLSKARLNKYSQACGGDKNKAIWLYQCNMKLSQRFYGVMQRDVYRELTEIREFRNRVAHYEPICFNASGSVCTAFVRHNYELIRKYIVGIPADSALGFIEKPDAIIRRLEEFRSLTTP